MAMTLDSLFTLYRYTPGRRAWMLGRIRAVAEGAGFSSLAARCEALLPDETRLASDLRNWTEVRAGAARERTSQALVALDQNRDGLLGDFHAMLQTLGRLQNKPRGQAAARLVKRLFPEGSRALITLPYPDETAAIEALLALAKGELAADITAADADDWIENLTAANAEFSQAYDALTEQRQVDFKAVRADDARAQERFLVLVCHLVDLAHGTPALAALLDPIEVQQRALKDLYQRRRAVNDVDPGTGEDLDVPVPTDPATPPPTA